MTHTFNSDEQGFIRQQVNLRFVLLLGLIASLAGCTSDPKYMSEAESDCSVVWKTDSKPSSDVLSNADDHLIVDCLLPSQIIQLGPYTQYMTRPRPAIISAWECQVQRGRYAIGATSDARQTALNVWQNCANQGDKVAQNYLGEIYAKSWGDIKPDFSQAAEWFRKAAEQGYSRAQNNLSTLYERGLGVPKDLEIAAKLYRQAIGPIAPVSLDPNTKKEIEDLSQKLNTTDQKLSIAEQLLRQKEEELDKLKKPGGSNDNPAQLQALRKQVSELKEQLSLAEQEKNEASKQLGKAKTHVALGNLPDLGKYHALIIGINDYQTPLAQLKTPVKDATQVEAILRRKYGFFDTVLLTDETPNKPTRENILDALSALTQRLKEGDNLLIYYAGHGDLSNGYSWLPQDAKSHSISQWISANDITNQIRIPPMYAKHVLVVVDSCYPAGIITSAITTTPITTAANTSPLIATRSGNSAAGTANLSTYTPDLAGTTPEAQIGWIKAIAELPSRNALTSGRLEKVLDADSGNGLSIFASAFLEALEKNDSAISAAQIFLDISPEVFAKAQKIGGNQVPVYTHIENTGDSRGEFFFIPHTKQSNRQNASSLIAVTTKE